jgi:hypothetical protein
MKPSGCPAVLEHALRLLAGPGIALLVLFAAGCSSVQLASTPSGRPSWEVDGSEILEWRADDPAFNQDHAIEASGLAEVDDTLLVLSEKYARLLVVDPARLTEARAIRLQVPRHSELEGIAVRGSTAYLCD